MRMKNLFSKPVVGVLSLAAAAAVLGYFVNTEVQS